MTISLLTLFPDYFDGMRQTSILARALEQGAVDIQIVNIRDFTRDKHNVTDDRPYGGGAGMVMKVDPITRAVESLGIPVATTFSEEEVQAAREQRQKAGQLVVTMAADGTRWTQSLAAETAEHVEHLCLICGHYEAIDARVHTFVADQQWRIGDYVLTGGEPAAAVITDSIVRLLPGVLGNSESLQGESHATAGSGAIPQYTRPQEFRGAAVPKILLGGHHAKIEEWRETRRSRTTNEGNL